MIDPDGPSDSRRRTSTAPVSNRVRDQIQGLQEEPSTLEQQASYGCDASGENLLTEHEIAIATNIDGPRNGNFGEDDEVTTSEEQCYHSSRAWKTWNQIIRRSHPIFLLLMVFLLWPAGFFAIRDLLPKTDSSFHDPVQGTPSSFAQDAFSHKYPGRTDASHDLFVVVQSKSETSLMHNEWLKHSSLELASSLQPKVFDSTTNSSLIGTIQVESYYGFASQNLTSLASSFMSHNESMTFLQVTLVIDRPSSPQTASTFRERVYFARLHDALEDYYIPASKLNLTVGFTGLKYFSNDLRISTQTDLHRMDRYVLPLAVLLLGYTLFRQQQKTRQPNFRNPFYGVISLCILDGSASASSFNSSLVRFWGTIWVFPVCGMISTVSIWSIVLNSIVLDFFHVQITQFTPSIMMSLTLGMGMDYSLFLLSRYVEHCEERRMSSSNSDDLASEAIEIMLEQTGKVVLTSGTALMATFVVFIALPLAMLQSIGIGAAVAIGAAIFANLVVIPSLLYMPHVGANIILPNPTQATNGDTDQENLHQPLIPTSLEDSDIEGMQNSSSREENEIVLFDQSKPSVWSVLARQVLHPYKSIIIVLLILQALLWPVAWRSHQLNCDSISLESLVPRDSPSIHVYNELLSGMGQDGGKGKMAPFRILLDGSKSNTRMDTLGAFKLQQDFVAKLLATKTSSIGYQVSTEEATVAQAKVSGISVIRNSPVPYPLYEAAKTCRAQCPMEAMRSLNYIDEQVTAKDRMATYFMVDLDANVSPFDKEGVAWLIETRKRVDAWLEDTSNDNVIDIHIDGVAAVAHDAVEAVYSAFPVVIAIALVVIFLLLGLVFQSIVPPLRSVVSISFTLAVSFGSAVLVYQDGFLNSLHMTSLMAVEPELCWIVPIMSFSIIIGLALDYDVFLVTRIFEYRIVEGYGHQSSIAAGLEATGGIITSAGIIMAISFGSLVASASVALDQWAFLLTVAVLLDTFVVRTLIVPAMAGWTGDKYSWYPRRLPPATRRLPGFDSPHDHVDFS